MKYEISGWLGKTGAGKTLDEVEQKVLDFALSGVEVWVCFWVNLDLPNIHFFSEFEEVENLRNAVVVFDEITDFFDPRDWENETKGVRRWFRLHRKHHLVILFNTQDISLVAKTVGTLCHHWYFLKANDFNLIRRFIRKMLGKQDDISLRLYPMTYQELKKMAVGFEVGEVMDAQGLFTLVNYPLKKILHRELNDKKIEIVHRYCPKCESRQGEQIKREDISSYHYDSNARMYRLNEIEFCPFCKTEKLVVRESGIYDTDYELPIKEKPITFQPMIDCPAGWRKIPYTGYLSDGQIRKKRQYEGRHLENGHYVKD